VTKRLASIVELEIESLAAGGDGVGRVAGRAVFVPRTAPGDRVTVEFVREHKNFVHARLLEVLTPGPGRREPRCRHFGECGGCSWQHVTPAVQRDARIRIARDALQRIGGFHDLPEPEWIQSPVEFGYRARARVGRADGRLGFRAHRSDRLVDVAECPVLDAMTQRELERVRAEPSRTAREFEIRGLSREAFGLRVSPGSFFQANGALWPAWQRAVVDACGTGACLVELYAGVGFCTTALEGRFDRVIAVERADSANDLRFNTKSQVLHMSAEAFTRDGLALHAPDVVLLNPPRKGCGRTIVDALRESGARRIVYVSCDPPTLARDLSRLGDRYALKRLVVIDALPQTHHVEVFVVLER